MMETSGKQLEIGDVSTLSDAQLENFLCGWAAVVVPDGAGWKVFYLNADYFEGDEATPFSDLEAAFDAIAEVLPRVNSEERRRWASRVLSRRRAEPRAPSEN